jgi:RNA polymerase sigma-70 factor (ECF subfamily)
MEGTSVTLLGRLREQPAAADWERLVALYRPFILRFIRLDPALSADAEDIGQDVMAKIVEHLPQFERQRDGSFRNWLKTITVNQVRLYWRQRLQHRRVNAEQGRLLFDALADPANELSQLWDAEYRGAIVRRLHDLVEPEFSPTSWRAFRMRVAEGRSTEEVAAALGISRNAVDIAKSRVLARLRREAAGLIED